MQHFTKNTVSVTMRCRRCKRNTPHRVWDGRVDPSHCLECFPEGPATTIKEHKILEVTPGAIYYREVERPLLNVLVPAACNCPRYPFGHYHALQRFDAEVERFLPGTWEARSL